ncbi:MFS transporter [Actinoplanes sp. NPDC049118]|uniref:MFS transporter n=1 Tax=Actinoplanes sp. NPDC049118 TaxID=3155769 RepID=UPI0033C57302
MKIPSVTALRGNRDFRLLWIGQFTSELGSSVAFVATPLIAIAVTGSTTQAGLLASTAFLASWLGSVPMGYLADRIAPRRLMLWCDAVRLVASAVLAVGVAAGFVSLWLLMVSGIVTTLAMLGFRPAATKMMRTILPEDQIATAVAANQLRGQAASLIGPALGGVLFHLGRSIPLVVDTASFALSLFCVGRLRPATATVDEPATRRRFLPELGEGFRLLWRTPFLRSVTSYATLTNIAVSILMFTIILGPGAESGGPAIGTALSVGAVAAMLGTILTPRLHRRVGLPALLLLITGVRVLTTAGAALAGGPAAAIAALAAVLLLQPVAATATETARIAVVPQQVYGRVSGTGSFVGSALQPLAPLIAGAAVQQAGAGWAFGVVAALFTAAGLVVGASRTALRVGAPAPAGDETACLDAVAAAPVAWPVPAETTRWTSVYLARGWSGDGDDMSCGPHLVSVRFTPRLYRSTTGNRLSGG